MKPDLLEGPGPDEEDSGLLHGGSMVLMKNKEMERGGDSETDLDRGEKSRPRGRQHKTANEYLLHAIKCVYVCVSLHVLLTTMYSYDGSVRLREGTESWRILLGRTVHFRFLHRGRQA